MASMKKQKEMVFHQEGATTPTGEPPPQYFAVPKSGKPRKSGLEQSVLEINEMDDSMGKASMPQSKVTTRTRPGLTSGKHPASSNLQAENLSPDGVCKGVRVTLDNNNMWNEFFRCKTEMILTKQGSRMFPYCRFRISGLQPGRRYSLLMDIQPLDNSCYKWTGKSWQVAGKAEHPVKSRPFPHPESPSTGQHWMQTPVSFYKLKVTNNSTNQDGNIILHPMHRYVPRLHVVQTDKAAKDIRLNGPGVITFVFPQTEFMAVTSYQNSQFAQLKVDYNPFMKGLKDEGNSWGLKLKPGKDSHKAGGQNDNEQHPLRKSLKSLLANHKPRPTKTTDSAVCKDLRENPSAKNESNPTIPENCSPCPAQKLFSEIIREAHISLQRCSLEHLGDNSSPSLRNEPGSIQSNSPKSMGLDDSKRDHTSETPRPGTPPQLKGETEPAVKKIDENPMKSPNPTFDLANNSEVSGGVASAVSQKSVGSGCLNSGPSEENTRKNKRPAPLPLPALALFLKQHLAKSKKANSKSDSPTPSFPSEPLASAAVSQSPLANCVTMVTPQADDAVPECDSDATACVDAKVDPDELAQKFTEQESEIVRWPSSPSCPEAGANTSQKESRTSVLTSISLAEERGPEAAVPDDAPLLPSTQPCSPMKSIPISTSTVASLPGDLSPPRDKLPDPSNALGMETKSSTLLSDSSPMMPLLPDPECSSFCFESFSPASSPEPLVSLACSQAQLDSINFETKQAEEKGHGNSSVFKWHTVIPLHEHYIDTSFSYQPTPQTLSLAAPPLLPPQTPEPQTFVSSTPPPEVALPFQENEHSLPFPGGLSPLQLPLSPTFSSLDGDGLSPTPSLTDLVHFFSNDDLGMGLDFSNSEPVAVPCPSPGAVEDHRQAQQEAANKRYKYKKSRRHKVLKNGVDVKNTTYSSMQPNLEEVEEQLFVSFTSKEALQLHLGEEKPPQPTASLDVQETSHVPENADTTQSLEEKISSFEKILHRDLKLMRHRQVIHPVLQEVGLKMNLLDPTLAIDLQYLGVRLPIPPPRASVEPVMQELHPVHGACSAFVSRTGKTTDVTQIKGWREKFTPAEAPSTQKPPVAEAVAAGSDSQKKNLSAFCSDMLDEYLENEGRLIDERASTFSQPVVDIAPPLAYELPTKSTSYVRTLHSVMQKQTGSTTSELISGFIPPSKRPKLSLKETRNFRRESVKQRVPKHNRPKPKPGQVDSDTSHTHPVLAHPDPVLPELPTLKRKRKNLKPNPTSQTVSLSQTPTPLPSSSEDMAPLDSDSELADPNIPNSNIQDDAAAVPTQQEGGAHGMTRALLRQKDLEDGVIWEGRHRTTVTEERASIALTSLFTLMGFVRENPTAPIQLACRRVPPCLNDFCRLGCICSSLAYCSRISHCGRPACMLGCSCLKQKVVLLKNLDGSDSSPSHHSKKRKKKRRMKMAYVLKEADSVSQPADRVRTLWRTKDKNHDPDPVHIPKRHNTLRRTEPSSCARVRAFRGKKSKHTDEVAPKGLKSKQIQPKSRRQGDLKPETRTGASPTGLPDHHSVGTSPLPSSPGEPRGETPEEPPPKPSKRLIILAECAWASDNDRSLVLKELCERMACDQLDKPFWVRQYFISPVAQTAEGGGTDSCIQYKIHISTPKLEPENPAASGETEQDQRSRSQAIGVVGDEESAPFDNWQPEVESVEAERPEDERHAAGDGVREAGVGSASKGDDGEDIGREVKERPKGKDGRRRANMGLPFLTGISPAGFLSANRKQPGERDHVIKVNGKLYPMAKVQLGKMGALHPANRLAAYLTGRVGSGKKQPSRKPPQFQSSAPAPQTTVQGNSGLTGNPPPGPDPSVKVTVPSTSTASRVITALAQPPNLPNKGSKMFMVPVLSSSGKVPAAQFPPPSSTSQKMVLYPVKSTSGVQYYRRPDGQLYRLLPMSQLRQFRLKQSGQTGPLPSVLPVVVRQTVSKAPPVTSVITNLPTVTSTISSSTSTFPTSTSCSSSTGSPPSSSLLGPLPSLAALLSQTNECTFRTLPTATSSLPSIRSVASAPPLDPSRLSAEQKMTPPLPPAAKTSEDASGPAPHSSMQQTGSELELDLNSSDLDVICVNDDAKLGDTGGGARRSSQAGREESSSGAESSDSEDGDTSRDEAMGPLRKNRLIQNTLEKLRRTKIRLLFDALRVELGSIDDRTSKASILQKAVQVIQQLVTLESKLRRTKRRLMKKRDRLMDTVALSGEREQLKVSPEQQILEQQQQQHTDNQLPAASGGAPGTPAGKKSRLVVEPLSKPRNNQRAPRTPVPTPVQAAKSPPAQPGVSHNAPVACNRQRTVPNILSHSRKPSFTLSNDTEVVFPAALQAELLSLVSSALPGQQVLSLQPVMSMSGVTSGNFNDPSLINQHTDLTSMPLPPTVEKLNNLLVPPSTAVQQQEVPANLPSPHPAPPPPHILLVPPGPERSSDQIRGQGHLSETLPSCPSSQGPSLVPDPGTGQQAEGGVRGSSEEPSKDCDWESLAPLPNDDVLLNQPMSTAHLQEESDHSSWLLRLDSDSDEPVASETEEAGLDDSTQFSDSKLLPGPTNGNITNGGALVPPPLLQMRVGGATAVATTSRPMPRLVPLGLRGTLPS